MRAPCVLNLILNTVSRKVGSASENPADIPQKYSTVLFMISFSFSHQDPLKSVNFYTFSCKLTGELFIVFQIIDYPFENRHVECQVM